MTCREIFEMLSSLYPLQEAFGWTSPHSLGTNGSVGLPRLRRLRLERDGSKSGSTRCAKACGGLAVGPGARIGEVELASAVLGLQHLRRPRQVERAAHHCTGADLEPPPRGVSVIPELIAAIGRSVRH